MSLIVSLGGNATVTVRSDQIDRHVGQQIRWLRRRMKISQNMLGNKLGLTPDQIRDYERGVKKIRAGMLHQIAQFFGVDVNYFFDATAKAPCRKPSSSRSVAPASDLHLKRVISAFAKIRTERLKKALADLIELLAEDDVKGHEG